MNAYHLHVQLGCIAQGLLQHLALNHTAEVWRQFRSWLRTMNSALPPSELVVACALRATLPEFLQAAALPHKLRNILRHYRELQQRFTIQRLRLGGRRMRQRKTGTVQQYTCPIRKSRSVHSESNRGVAGLRGRPKTNCSTRTGATSRTDRAAGIIADQNMALNGSFSQREYPIHLRCIRFHDSDTGTMFCFDSM